MKASLLVETDILSDYLGGGESLRKALASYRCYTSFVQMMEILSCARDRQEKDALMKLFTGLRVLGFHSRYSLRAAEFMQEFSAAGGLPEGLHFRCALVAAIASEAKLEIYTKRFSGIYEKFSAVATIEEF